MNSYAIGAIVSLLLGIALGFGAALKILIIAGIVLAVWIGITVLYEWLAD